MDLARLSRIKAEREAAQARRRAEAEGELLPFRRVPRLTACTSQSSRGRSQEGDR